MDSRFDFIRFLIDLKTPIYMDKNIIKNSNIKKYWEKLGYQILKKGNQNNKFIYLYKSRLKKIKLADNEDEYICIPSLNNPRWIIKHDKNIIKNHGLIIKPSSFKAKLVWNIAKLFNKFSLFTVIFPYRILLKNSAIKDKITFNKSNLTVGIIYTGTLGKFQKFTIQFIDKNYNVVNFLKLATTKEAILRIKNEEYAINCLKSKSLNNMFIPNLLQTVNNDFYGILQSNIIHTNYMTLELTQLDIDTINELYLKSKQYEKTFEYYYFKLVEKIEVDELNISNNFLELIKNKKIIFTISHGDYIPWNRFIESKKIKIIDWEMFAYRPIFYDIYYYLIHKTILIDNQNIINIFEDSLEAFSKITSVNITQDMKIVYMFLISLELYIHYKKNDESHDQDILNNLKENIEYLKIKILQEFRYEYIANK